MQKLLKVLVFTGFWLASAEAAEIVVAECVEDDQNLSYRDACPPGVKQVGEKKLSGLGGNQQPSLEAIAENAPITLYTVPDCDACDLVRNVLSGRSFPFTEKNVQDNADLQQELKALSGGLTVPALKIGERTLTGYSRDAIDAALENAGYPMASAASE